MKSNIQKNEFPILEFDRSAHAVIEPFKIYKKIKIPKHAVICFFGDVINKLITGKKVRLIKNLVSEMGMHPVYEYRFRDKEITIFNPGIGAPLAAGLFEEVIALGCRYFIACGGAGVLNKDITYGNIIIPTSAIRDEGTSYHYIAPGREIKQNKKGVNAIVKTLKKHKCKFIKGKTWSTDAFFRETHEKVKMRRNEGCISVDMEASALFAVAKFRKVVLGQILYGGDDVSCEEWDQRRTPDRFETREKIFEFAVEACLEL